MSVELSEALLREAAGWDVMKRARAYLEQGQVLNSHWDPPRLHGVVRAGDRSIPATLLIPNPADLENQCACREAREWGKICAHSVAVGLHWLRSQSQAPPHTVPSRAATPPAAPRRAGGLARAADGEPAELWVVFPPQFEQAVARGKVMLVFEVGWGGGRRPLNALPAGRPYAFAPEDAAVLDHVGVLTRGETPALLQLGLKDLAELLPRLVDHPRLTLGKARPVRVTSAPLAWPLRAVLEASGEIRLELRGARPSFVSLGEWVWQDAVVRPLGLPGGVREVLHGPVRVPREQVPDFMMRQWPQFGEAGGIEADFEPTVFTLETPAPKLRLQLEGGLAQLTAQLHATYGGRDVAVGGEASADTVWLPDAEVATRYLTRDLAAERAALARVQRSGFTGPDAEGRLQLSGQDAVFEFFAREFPRLQREWKVTLEERLERSAARQFERVEPQFEVTPSGERWFDLGVVFRSRGGDVIPPAEVQRWLRSGRSHTRLPNGKVALMDTGAVEELQAVLLDCAPRQHAEGYRISSRQAGFVAATLQQQPGWRVQAPAAWNQRAAQHSGEVPLACPPLGDLESVLRPYQKQGVAWLHFLRTHGFGGILADEMGLGKTLQTLAALRFARQSQAGLPPMLIVCPTSLVFNWVAEAARFTPDLKVLALHGPGRHAEFARLPASDLVVTSYALIRRDADRYREVTFDTVVLDEAQHIKNRQTQNAQAVKAVRAAHRLVLTGTPLENSVLDLWSIFDFLMPGYLGSAKDFRERYELPITRDRDAQAQARLARRLRPFLLRRLKREVAADLPAKLEQVAYCELTPTQRGVYEQVLDAGRREVLEAVGAAGEARSRMVMLNALLRLRQVCCDLRLLPGERSFDPAEVSGKLDLFSELLAEALDGGHRVLVFSQFVSLLTLLRERLEAEGLGFCYLDGSTTDRAAVVQRFQGDASIPVFLISLKAGGTGLNLTGADTVIHFDPWWNPAVEDQATDRAHRIGQRQVVTSYKLIARDTVEEKILNLQARKRDVSRATLGGEEELATSLTWDELRELLG
ncbi:MAG: SNF2 helicase associated domain-containing protein [Verrucomicrobiales bacterium]|nr:SNF2 helicase associated domain-containing protein [Verrucomicrobiales bacterium]